MTLWSGSRVRVRLYKKFFPRKVGKLGGGGDNRWCLNFNPSTPKPDSRHNYKTFCLKDHILLSKKRPCPSNITFHWNSMHLAKGGHWEKRHQLNIMTPIQLFIIHMTSKPPQASAGHPQISSRHCQTPTDTIQTPQDIQGVLCKKLKYGKPRLGESTLT